MAGRFHPRGVRMRDYCKGRAGFDRVLMAVAATFLTVSATAAFAQADTARSTAAELAIDAAIPRPEPANVPPPTIADFKIDTTASVKPDTTATVPSFAKQAEEMAKPVEKAAETKPADVPASNSEATKNDIAAPATVAPAEPVKAASNVPPTDQPV